jgi:hypothetical protein
MDGKFFKKIFSEIFGRRPEREPYGTHGVFFYERGYFDLAGGIGVVNERVVKPVADDAGGYILQVLEINHHSILRTALASRYSDVDTVCMPVKIFAKAAMVRQYMCSIELYGFGYGSHSFEPLI